MADLFLLSKREASELKELAKLLMDAEGMDKYVLKRNIMHLMNDDVYLSANQAKWWYKSAQINDLEAPNSLTRLILE